MVGGTTFALPHPITQHIRCGYALPFGTLLPSVATSYMLEMSGCVKTHVCMKNKAYAALKSKNKVKNSQNFRFSHSLTLCEIKKIQEESTYELKTHHYFLSAFVYRHFSDDFKFSITIGLFL
jgi:hypothetical protein